MGCDTGQRRERWARRNQGDGCVLPHCTWSISASDNCNTHPTCKWHCFSCLQAKEQVIELLPKMFHLHPTYPQTIVHCSKLCVHSRCSRTRIPWCGEDGLRMWRRWGEDEVRMRMVSMGWGFGKDGVRTWCEDVTRMAWWCGEGERIWWGCMVWGCGGDDLWLASVVRIWWGCEEDVDFLEIWGWWWRLTYTTSISHTSYFDNSFQFFQIFESWFIYTFNHNSTEKNIKSCEESSHHDHDYFLVHRDSGTVHERLLLVKIMITSHIILSKIEN